MHRSLSALFALFAGAAWGQAPAYTAAGIVNASDYSAGPFAPNSILSLFGANLARSTQATTANEIVANTLPFSLGGVQVIVSGWLAPLFYVSPTQINFIIPSNLLSDMVQIRVVREGLGGPEVPIRLTVGAPALFDAGGFALATDAVGAVLTSDAPALPGAIIVIYATGLGKSQPDPGPGVLPQSAATIVNQDLLKVYLDGVPLEPIYVKYAGLTPYYAGLYQINLELPAAAPSNPEIRVSITSVTSMPGLKIPVR